MVSEQFNFPGVGFISPMPNPQLSWRTDDFLSGLSPLADQFQFWSVGNSLFALTWLSRINVAQEPWRGHACIGLSRDIRHYSSFISMLLSARCTPSRPSYSFGSHWNWLLLIYMCVYIYIYIYIYIYSIYNFGTCYFSMVIFVTNIYFVYTYTKSNVPSCDAKVNTQRK